MRSRELVEAAIHKIQTIDQSGYGLKSVLALRSQALADADEYDKTASSTGDMPLGGIPILIKDNVEAIGLPATAGSLALADTPVTEDAPIVKLLKAAGAIIIGSTNLSEWANIRSTNSTSGWSAVGGLTANPWIHKHSAGGSSSGSGAAVAANLVQFAIGTETDGSIICPASLNGCVGIKPTVGKTSRDRVVPISASQDSPGPMTQTVDQAALMLSVMTGDDTLRQSLTDGSDMTGLRIGVVRGWMTDHQGTNALFQSAVNTLAKAGINLVDVELSPPKESVGDDEYAVLMHELVSDLGNYLKSRTGSQVKSLGQVQSFNIEHRDTEMKYFKQEIFDLALREGGRGPKYQMKRDRNLLWANQTLTKGFADVDILIGCTYGPAWISTLGEGDSFSGSSWITTAPSIAGTPIGTVPMGITDGLPVGLGVVAPRNHEHQLLKAMKMIESTLGFGILTPTFTR